MSILHVATNSWKCFESLYYANNGLLRISFNYISNTQINMKYYRLSQY